VNGDPVRSSLLLVGIVGGALLAARSAHAQVQARDDSPHGDPYPLTPTPPLEPMMVGEPYVMRSRARDDWAFQFTLSGGYDWFRRMPRLSFASDPEELPGRNVPSLKLPSAGSLDLAHVGFDTGVLLNDRVKLPLFGMIGAWAVGPSPRIVTSVDGSMAEMRTWSTGAVTFLLPGLGLSTKARRWMFSASARALASYEWMSVSVASAGGGTDVIADRWSLGLRADVAACRRLDVVERICLAVSPHVYEGRAFLNGGSLELRWELGR
jgi:hypothetical protein